MSGLQSGLTGLQSSVTGLQSGQKQLQQDVRRLEVLHKETSSKIDQIIESVSPEMVRNNEQEQVAAVDENDQVIGYKLRDELLASDRIRISSI